MATNENDSPTDGQAVAGRENEFEDPGGNYPDRGGPDGDAQPDVSGEQGEPLLEQNDASTDEKVAGIVDQTRADVGHKSLRDVSTVLRQRLIEAGLTLPDSEIERLAHQAVDFR